MTVVEKKTLSQLVAIPVKPHPSNKMDIHKQSTDIIYSKVRSYMNPIKTWDSFTHAQTVYTRPLPSFGRGLGTRLSSSRLEPKVNKSEVNRAYQLLS